MKLKFIYQIPFTRTFSNPHSFYVHCTCCEFYQKRNNKVFFCTEHKRTLTTTNIKIGICSVSKLKIYLKKL